MAMQKQILAILILFLMVMPCALAETLVSMLKARATNVPLLASSSTPTSTAGGYPGLLNFKYLNYHANPEEIAPLADYNAAVSASPENAQAFKTMFPDKIALLFVPMSSWGSRRPTRPEETKFTPALAEIFPGHFMLMTPATLTANLAANPMATRIYVSNSGIFRVGDDVMLYALDQAGRPDWTQTEEVHVTGVGSGYIDVQRAQHIPGAVPRAFAANHARAAVHANIKEPPPPNYWRYNFCLNGPRDSNGDRAIEVMARYLGEKLNGEWSFLDGYEFDVASWSLRGMVGNADVSAGRLVDCDQDGVPDNGFFNGQSSYGLGLNEWVRQMRVIVGPDKLILGDSNNNDGWRPYSEASGVEMESFPNFDSFEQFDSAFDRLRLWGEIASPYRRLSYAYSKINTSVWPGNTTTPQPPGPEDYRFRVGVAAAALLDAFHAYSTDDPDTIPYWNYIYDWDEYHGGTLDEQGFLGAPLEPYRRITEALGTTNYIVGGDFEGGVSSWGLEVRAGAAASGPLWDTAAHSGSHALKVDVTDVVPVWPQARDVALYYDLGSLPAGTEVTFSFWAKAEPVYADPALTRSFVVAFEGSPYRQGFQATRHWRHYYATLLTPDRPSHPSQRLLVWLGDETSPFWLDDVELRVGGAALFTRRFERGIVLLNMTRQPYTFALPGTYRRIEGVWEMPPGGPNDGARRLTEETVPPWDARFLLEQ